MKTETNDKQEYIQRWQDHVKDFSILAFCNDEKLSKRIREIQEELNEIIPKVAETKKGWKK